MFADYSIKCFHCGCKLCVHKYAFIGNKKCVSSEQKVFTMKTSLARASGLLICLFNHIYRF